MMIMIMIMTTFNDSSTPIDRALYAHFCIVHLMAKDCYERLNRGKRKGQGKRLGKKKEKEREQMQQWMSEYTIDDIVLNENKYRGLLTVVEFLGGPQSILYEPTFQSLDFAKTLLKALNETANHFKHQVL
ncbi:hypothetical protein RFI_19910 [Reticulomyxa filosa]|uniref:Uncharacterized protein n=1 Tax=Reticulomyxa filosa TaxID=46433 RepID=X6MUD9_RETFI|nr:hypothetical protein RFI_19910 [Reticulomyxa filosa]|eukprot:ETO17414.1 hypothetical protein RFI_19910 [Reticulomyxa filosa]